MKSDPCTGAACIIVAWLVVRRLVTTKYVHRGSPDYFASAFPSEEDARNARSDAGCVDLVFGLGAVGLAAWYFASH